MSKYIFSGSSFDYGYYAYLNTETGDFVLGEERGREGGSLYQGEYKGDETPYINTIKTENPKLYNSIKKYFRKHEKKEPSTYKITYQITLSSYINANSFEEACEEIQKYGAISNLDYEDFKPIKCEKKIEHWEEMVI